MDPIPNLFKRVDLRKLYPGYAGSVAYTRCPAHDDSGRPNLAVYPHNTFCFVCRHRETALEHIMRLFNTDSRYEAMQIIEKLINDQLVFSEEANRVDMPPLEESIVTYYRKKLYDDVSRQDWLRQKYGLHNRTLLACKVGYTGKAFALPVYDVSNNLVNIRFRKDPDRCPEDMPKYWAMAGYNAHVWFLPPNMRGVEPWPVDTLLEASERVLQNVWEEEAPYIILTEGEYDALAASEQGYPAVSALNGVRSLLSPKAIPMLQQLKDLSTVYLAYDQDTAGQAGAECIQEKLESMGLRVINLEWDSDMGKDVSEKWLQGLDVFQGTSFENSRTKPLTTV